MTVSGKVRKVEMRRRSLDLLGLGALRAGLQDTPGSRQRIPAKPRTLRVNQPMLLSGKASPHHLALLLSGEGEEQLLHGGLVFAGDAVGVGEAFAQP